MKPDYIGATLRKTAALFKREAVIDDVTFRHLLSPVKDHLYNFILKALNFSEDADDVYQESVLRAFKYRASYKRDQSFKTWIFTIAHNEIKRYFKKHKAQRTVDLQEHSAPEDENAAMVHAVYETAQQLKPKQRRVFFLFYDQGFSAREVGEITGLKEGNVRFILNRARERIKETLKQGGDR